MGKLGCFGLFIVILVVLVFGGNEMFGFYLSHCDEDDEIIDCLLAVDDETETEGTVTATGVYTYKDYSVNMTAHIPLEGGAVTGVASGTCEGMVKGTFDGQNNGVISGSMNGACSPFFINIPASAEFSGTVNKDTKTIPFEFTGQGGGLTHKGSMTLTY